jgi:hypothetical protein
MGANDPNINVKDLLPFTLAGYFSDSIFVGEKVISTDTKPDSEENTNKTTE